MKVILKTNFSSPLLVNEEDPPLKDLANPVPLDCMKITTIKTIAKSI